MEDIHSFHTRNYDKASKFNVASPLQRILTLLPLLPSIIAKTLLVVLLEIFFVLLELFHLIVPKPMKNIRGQLAAVGAKNKIGAV